MFIAMYAAPTFAKGLLFSLGTVLFNAALWAAAGAGFGAIMWYGSEANYRKLKRRQ